MRKDIWFSLFFLGILLFGWPFPAIFRDNTAAYLFTIWPLFIALIAVAARLSDREDGG